MANVNSNLIKAQKAKKDEFYTRLEDIQNELGNYTRHFKDKVVYCNCDDPRVSNFFYYFSHRFHSLGLKKLMTTCYKNKQRDMFSQHDSEQAISLSYDGFREGEQVPNVEDIGIHHLEGDGDFRSAECIELLKQADIVVTNPPFSLFREYVAQLAEYNKKFLIIGPLNAIKYKEIFPLLKENKIWLGYGFRGVGIFNSPYQDADQKQKMVKMGNVHWFTNLDIKKRNEKLILYKEYNPEEYPRYDNYDAVEVSEVKDIPKDYKGAMGVPISFLDKFNPNQFEIIDLDRPLMKELTGKVSCFWLGGREKYSRIVIKNKKI